MEDYLEIGYTEIGVNVEDAFADWKDFKKLVHLHTSAKTLIFTYWFVIKKLEDGIKNLKGRKTKLSGEINDIDDVVITKIWDNCIDFQVTSYGKNKEKFCDDYHLSIIFFLYPIAYVNDLEKEYLRLKESKENP